MSKIIIASPVEAQGNQVVSLEHATGGGWADTGQPPRVLAPGAMTVVECGENNRIVITAAQPNQNATVVLEGAAGQGGVWGADPAP